MELLSGVALMCATVLFINWAIGAFRRPDPSRWATWEASAVGVSLVGCIALAFALGFLAAGLITAPAQIAEVGILGTVGALVAIPVSFWLSKALSAPARRPASDVAEVVEFPPRGPAAAGAPRAGRPPRRKAA